MKKSLNRRDVDEFHYNQNLASLLLHLCSSLLLHQHQQPENAIIFSVCRFKTFGYDGHCLITMATIMEEAACWLLLF